jgi:hypothetical protein
MRLIIHPGDGSEMARWFVPLRCTSHKGLLPPEGTGVTVFACGADGAKLAAVEKATDKYLRHQNKRTRWVVTGEPKQDQRRIEMTVQELCESYIQHVASINILGSNPKARTAITMFPPILMGLERLGCEMQRSRDRQLVFRDPSNPSQWYKGRFRHTLYGGKGGFEFVRLKLGDMRRDDGVVHCFGSLKDALRFHMAPMIAMPSTVTKGYA